MRRTPPTDSNCSSRRWRNATITASLQKTPLPARMPCPCQQSDGSPGCRSASRLRGRRRESAPTLSAAPAASHTTPMPLGPYSLCAENDIKSTIASTQSIATLPAPCAASTCNNAPCSRTCAPMPGMSLSVPSSLFTSISDTRKVVFTQRFADRVGADQPIGVRHQIGRAPRRPCSCRAVSRVALCSIWLVMICPPATPRAWATPLIARLFDSVAPEVQTICLGAGTDQFGDLATCLLDRLPGGLGRTRGNWTQGCRNWR